MNTILIICAIIVTLAVSVAVAFLVRTLNQIRKTAREAEILLRNINLEVSTIGRITGTLSAFVERVTSPWIKMGGWAAGMFSTMFGKKKAPTAYEEPCGREEVIK